LARAKVPFQPFPLGKRGKGEKKKQAMSSVWTLEGSRRCRQSSRVTERGELSENRERLNGQQRLLQLLRQPTCKNVKAKNRKLSGLISGAEGQKKGKARRLMVSRWKPDARKELDQYYTLKKALADQGRAVSDHVASNQENKKSKPARNRVKTRPATRLAPVFADIKRQEVCCVAAARWRI